MLQNKVKFFFQKQSMGIDFYKFLFFWLFFFPPNTSMIQ